MRCVFSFLHETGIFPDSPLPPQGEASQPGPRGPTHASRPHHFPQAGPHTTRMARPEGGGPGPIGLERGMQGPCAQVGPRAASQLDNQIPKECPREQGGPVAKGPPPRAAAPRQIVPASATTLSPSWGLHVSPATPWLPHTAFQRTGSWGRRRPPRSGGDSVRALPPPFSGLGAGLCCTCTHRPCGWGCLYPAWTHLCPACPSRAGSEVHPGSSFPPPLDVPSLTLRYPATVCPL